MKYEPIMITTLVAALMSMLISFGVNISDEQSSAILKFLDAILPLVPFAIAAVVARRKSWSENSVEIAAGTSIENAEKILESKKGM
jgi:F0F1-type ATP synthase assembly protein I